MKPIGQKNDRAAIITGAGRGLDRAIAKELVEAGISCVITGRRRMKLATRYVLLLPIRRLSVRGLICAWMAAGRSGRRAKDVDSSRQEKADAREIAPLRIIRADDLQAAAARSHTRVRVIQIPGQILCARKSSESPG